MWQPTSPTEPTSASPPPTAADAIPSRARSESTRQKNPGRRFAQIVKLKPEHIDEYKECHAKVWPEVLKQIKECGITDYSIFHDEQTGILFASFKYVGYDWAGDQELMASNPKVREWWRMTDGFQESMVPGAVSSEAGEPGWWRPIEEVFYCA